MNIDDIKKKLWDAANQLRGNMSSEEYMHIILGVLSLKYISDRYDIGLSQLHSDGLEISDLSAEEFYSEYNSFKVPETAHWTNIMEFASTSEIGQKMDEAFISLENENPMLNGVFNKNYNSEAVDPNRLGEVVKIFSNEDFTKTQEDIIGRIYEYFLGKFFKDRGQTGGEFYTPSSIVELIVGIIKPLKGTIYDPACGTGGMLIQAKRYIQEHDGNIDEISIYGQEYNNVTWKLAKLNLVLNNFTLIDNDNHGVLGDKSADTFSEDQHQYKKFDFVMANPPFNMKNWGREKLIDDPRWGDFGLPPKGNGNYAWLLHILDKLSSQGKAGVVLANGSLSSNGKEEKAIRKTLLEKNKVDAIISLPDKLFYTTGISACIWIFNNNKVNDNVLMIDASNLDGVMLNKKLRKLSSDDISKISSAFEIHQSGKDIEETGFAKTVSIDEIKQNDFSFVPGRYVGFIEEEVDKEAIKKEIEEVSQEISVLFREFEKLIPETEKAIKKALQNNK